MRGYPTLDLDANWSKGTFILLLFYISVTVGVFNNEHNW
jgi:hypothetical protein